MMGGVTGTSTGCGGEGGIEGVGIGSSGVGVKNSIDICLLITWIVLSSTNIKLESSNVSVVARVKLISSNE